MKSFQSSIPTRALCVPAEKDRPVPDSARFERNQARMMMAGDKRTETCTRRRYGQGDEAMTFAGPGSSTGDLTGLLQAWQGGDTGAGEALFRRVYADLRRIAGRHFFAREDLTIEPTEAVNEAYLKLLKAGHLQWHNRRSFFALASEVVRQVLVDHQRRHAALKRGGAAKHVEVDASRIAESSRSVDILALDEAMTRLAAHDPRAARIVELRYFGGLTVPEVADLLGIGTATVSRRWQMARAWLRRELTTEEHRDDSAAGR